MQGGNVDLRSVDKHAVSRAGLQGAVGLVH